MTDLETVRNDLEHRDMLPQCWRDDARELEGIGFGDDVRPWNWLELNEHEAAKLWAYLERFVSYFNARYGERAALRVPPCWALHGPLVEELTTLAFARWQAFSSAHASIGGAQYFHGYTLPAFYERLRFWLGSDLLSCQQGHHRRRDEYGIDRLEEWQEHTEALRDEDLWLRGWAPRSPRARGPPSSRSLRGGLSERARREPEHLDRQRRNRRRPAPGRLARYLQGAGPLRIRLGASWIRLRGDRRELRLLRRQAAAAGSGGEPRPARGGAPGAPQHQSRSRGNRGRTAAPAPSRRTPPTAAAPVMAKDVPAHPTRSLLGTDHDGPVRRTADRSTPARAQRLNAPRFLRVEDAARVLAISRSTAYELAGAFIATDGREGLPVIRLGTALRVPVRALERWSEVGMELDDP